MPFKPRTHRTPGQEQQRVAARRDYDQHRGNRHQRGYDSHWSAFAKQYLQLNPLCVDCDERGIVTAAAEVHHTRKLAEHPDSKYDADTLRPLCKPCHSVRTAKGE